MTLPGVVAVHQRGWLIAVPHHAGPNASLVAFTVQARQAQWKATLQGLSGGVVYSPMDGVLCAAVSQVTTGTACVPLAGSTLNPEGGPHHFPPRWHLLLAGRAGAAGLWTCAPPTRSQTLLPVCAGLLPSQGWLVR